MTPSSSSSRARPWGSASTRWVPSPPHCALGLGWITPEGAATSARSQKSGSLQPPLGLGMAGGVVISEAR